MGETIVKVRKSMDWVFFVEGCLIVLVVGLMLHHYGLHGAAATAIGIVVAFILITLVIRLEWMFWIWTLLVSALLAVGAYSLVRHWQDVGWSLLGGALTVLIVIGGHRIAREDIRAVESIVIED